MEKPELPKNATDLEYALTLIQHIEAPCHDLAGNSLRDFYLREAIRVLPSFKDSSTKALLEEIIAKYKE
jgi:hypothetical protein